MKQGQPRLARCCVKALGFPRKPDLASAQLEALGDRVARRGLVDKPRSDIGEKRAPKFRDPQSGATWSGRGREPGWLKGKNRQDFAVKE